MSACAITEFPALSSHSTTHGTAFRVYLPLCDTPVRQPTPASKLTPPFTSHTSHGETILLVEDDLGIRKVATKALRRRGYTVFPAA